MEDKDAQVGRVAPTEEADAVADHGKTPASFTLPDSLMGINNPSKKRKNRRGVTARGETALPKNRGNGFEEYFADPPMTPAEAQEEKMEIYHPDLPFIERMQACIQRYRSRRRLQADRTLFFSEYLFLGGVDTNPAPYGGLDPRDLKDLTPAERREATATDIIYGTTAAGDKFYNGDDEAWTVDFAGVAAGFFSVTLVAITSFEPKLMEQGIDVVDNFLRYVLHHDVCPEYKDSINTALAICEDARREWPMVRELQASLPGHFNLAAGELFRPDDAATNWSFQHFDRPEGFDAKTIFYSSIALMDEPELFSQLLEKATVPRVVNEFHCSVELVGISHPNDDIVKRFKSIVIGDGTLKHVPVGKAMFKPAVIEDDWVSPIGSWPIEDETMTLFFDDHLLDNMPLGMKARLDVCELDVGLRFVNAVDMIVPSFYLHLPQELMRYYKTPRDWDRPAPSIHDPNAEEKEHAAEAKA